MDSLTDAPNRDDDAEIRYRAYMIWLAQGQPDGCADEHWYQAVAEEQLLRQSSVSTAAGDRAVSKTGHKAK
jgi:hypothetical protein